MADLESEIPQVKSILSDILAAINNQTDTISSTGSANKSSITSANSETISLFREMNINLRAIMSEVSVMRKVVEGRIKFDSRLKSAEGKGAQYREVSTGQMISYDNVTMPGTGLFKFSERTRGDNPRFAVGDPKSPFADLAAGPPPGPPVDPPPGPTGEQSPDPLKTSIKSLIDSLKKITKDINKLVDPVRKLQQQFGITAGAAARLRLEALGQSIASVVTSLSTAPVSFKEIEAAASDLRAEFGGIVSTKEAAEFAVAAKDMGVTTQQLAAARRVFMTQTMGDLAGAQSQQERFIKVFTQQGMTSKDAMEFIGKNSELLARSGTRFQQSMARAAAEAKKIGVDLSKVNQVGDNIIGNFEGFLESMAELGAMGFGFDATRLAEVAERGDTSALFDELRSQLRMTGRDLTDLTRSQQLALSNAFGMNIEDFQRLAGETPDIGEAEKTSVFLKFMVDNLERIALTLSGISTLLGTFKLYYSYKQLGLLQAIAANTSKFGMGSSKGTGIGGTTERMPGGPGSTGGSPGTPGILDKLLQIKPSQLLAAGAAMIMVAGATFILAKAMQEFSTGVNWKGVSTGVTSLSSLAVIVAVLGKVSGPVLKGSAAMVVLGGAMWVLGKAMQEFSDVDWKDVGVGITSISSLAFVIAGLASLTGSMFKGAAAVSAMAGALWVLGKSLKEFIGIDWTTLGIAVTGLSSIAFVIAGLSTLVGPMLMGAVGVAAMAGALWVLGKSLKEFIGIDWKTLGVAVTGLSSVALVIAGLSTLVGPMLIGAVGVAAMAGALWVLGKSLKEFIGVDWSTLGVAVTGLSSLAFIIAGFALITGPMFIGAAAVTAMAGALWVLGKSMESIGTGIASAISSIGSVSEYLDILISKVGGIALLSMALLGLAASLTALGVAGLIAMPALLALGAISGISSLMGRKKGKSDGASAGHGDRTLVTPDKTVSLNNDDTVVAMAPDRVMDGHDVISTNAGTELLSKGIIAKSAGDSEPNINVNVDLEKLERKLDQVISAMASMQVVMDGNKVGRVMSDNEQKANTMGIFQTQRLTG
jgi:hypothetical protein